LEGIPIDPHWRRETTRRLAFSSGLLDINDKMGEGLLALGVLRLDGEEVRAGG
jgi:hypothetical protein